MKCIQIDMRQDIACVEKIVLLISHHKSPIYTQFAPYDVREPHLCKGTMQVLTSEYAYYVKQC